MISRRHIACSGPNCFSTIRKGGAVMAGEASIQVVCACGKKLKAPATSAGKKARCPACGKVMVLTANAPVKTPAARVTSAVSRPASPPAEDDGLGALYDLAEQANSAAPPP